VITFNQFHYLNKYMYRGTCGWCVTNWRGIRYRWVMCQSLACSSLTSKQNNVWLHSISFII